MQDDQMDYAEAVNRLGDDIASALARADSNGLSDKEQIDELRRIADEMERG